MPWIISVLGVVILAVKLRRKYFHHRKGKDDVVLGGAQMVQKM